MTTPPEVVARRRAVRDELLDEARRFAGSLDPMIEPRFVAVFGSVARGDWNDRSDIDVLVVADGLPSAPLERLDAVGLPPSRVEVVVWSVSDWRSEHRRGNPIATEAVAQRLWLLGTPIAVGQVHPD